MNDTQQILVTELEDKVSKLSVNKKELYPDVRKLEKEVSKLSLNKDKKEKSDKKFIKKELSSDIKILEDKKNKPIKKTEELKNILCGFPLITKKGEKCTNKGLSDCGGRCKMHNGK